MRSRLETKRARRKICWSRVFIVLFVLLAMMAACAGAAFYAYLNLFDNSTASRAAVATSGGAGKIPADAFSKRINILLLGIDDGDSDVPGGGPTRSDTVIVASINPEDGTVNLLSIPRDTRVAIPGRKGYDKITHAHAYGGAALAVRTVEDFLQIPIQYYVEMDWQGFIQVVDILGGVDLYVEQDMNYEDPYADLSIHLRRGYQHLNGQEAGQYVRYRHDELGDIGRVQRQQKFLKALDEQMFSLGTIWKLPALTSTLKQYVATDMSTITMLKVANTLKGFTDNSLRAELLPGTFATIDGLSYWVPDKDQTRQLVETMFTSAGSNVSGTIPGATRTN